MDRTGKIAVTVAFIVMFGWFYYQSTIPQPPPPVHAGASPTPAPSASQSPAVAGATPQPSASPSTVNPAEPASTPAPVLPEETQELKAGGVLYTFTNHGGGIAKATLLDHLIDQDSKKNVVLNDFGVAPIGAISFQQGIDIDASYTSTVEQDKSAITYHRTAGQLEITKKFTLSTATTDDVDRFIATLDVTFTNRGSQPPANDSYFIYLGSAAPIHEHDVARYISMDWYRAGSAKTINVVSDFSPRKILGYQWSTEKAETLVSADKISWAGMYNQYFTTIITPVGATASSVWADRYPVDVPSHATHQPWQIGQADSSSTSYAINGALGMPSFDLKPGASVTQQFKIYTGPRQNLYLKKLDGDQAAILHLGYSGAISKLLLRALIWLKNKVGSYAFAIILLTVALKLAMWPLQNRSTQSMKKMQALNPKMTELRDKYKDDPARYNQEMMKLYKTYGVNPLAGCLPMVIQLPIFVAFYSMLGSAVELRNSTFFWVHDLSQPDTIGHFSSYPINILPLCMAVTSAWMIVMTPKTGDASQRNMMFITPVILLLFCYNYASGLALYMMVSNLFSVIQFIVTKNQTAPKMEKLPPPGKGKNKR